MRGSSVALLIATTVILGGNCIASAGPQSALDPYAYIQAPPTRGERAQDYRKHQKQPKRKPVKAPPSVLKTAPSLPDYSASAPVSKPAKTVTQSATANATAAASQGSAPSSGGVIAGTKEMFHGIGTASKGAAAGLFSPIKKIGSGTVAGSKKLGEGVTSGAKNSGSFFTKGASAVGHGFASAGEKVKDGTATAGHAVISFPKAIGRTLHLTHDEKLADAKKPEKKEKDPQAVAAKPEPNLSETNPEPVAQSPAPTPAAEPSLRPEAKVAEGKAATEKPKETASLANKIMGAPKAFGKGIAGAAAKTGASTKKLAGGFGKLNPFKHEPKPPIATASKEEQQPPK